MKEPNQITAAPRPCSTPHSAPVQWLRSEPAETAPPDQDQELSPEEQRRRDIADFVATCERLAPEQERRDGWSPFLRKLFLQVIAEGGTISAACEYTGMSRSSAYSLEARDRVFAAGLAAAAYFARNPLADDFYEKAKNGITETVSRSDGATITRHRFDSRLSIAVLNRLDKRCDRAEERGSVHMAAVRNWDEFLALVGKGDDQAAEALLETPQLCPTCPLPERANPIPDADPPAWDLGENVWQIGDDRAPGAHRDRGLPDGTWMTCFPPPPGFDLYQNIEWDGVNWYERACTPNEAELLETHAAAVQAEERAELAAFARQGRDTFFARLRTELTAVDPALRRESSLSPGTSQASPPPPPAASPAAAAAEQSDQDQEDDRAERGVDDRTDHAGAEVQPDLRQQPAADERPDDSEQQVADDSEAGPADQAAGQPAGNDADDHHDQQALIRHVHCSPPPL